MSDEGYGVGVSLSIKDVDEELASIERVRRADGTNVVVSHRAIASHDENGKRSHEHNDDLADCDLMDGKLRVGRRLHYPFFCGGWPSLSGDPRRGGVTWLEGGMNWTRSNQVLTQGHASRKTDLA